MKKIDKLTDAQTARIPAFRDAWMRAGLSTEPADRPRAEAGVRLAYEAAGLQPPGRIIWLDSPMAGALGAALLAGAAKVQDRVWTQVWTQVRDQVGAQVWAQVVGQVRDRAVDQVGAQVWTAIPGQHDAGWMAFYAYFAEVVGVPIGSQIRGLSEVALAMGLVVGL